MWRHVFEEKGDGPLHFNGVEDLKESLELIDFEVEGLCEYEGFLLYPDGTLFGMPGLDMVWDAADPRYTWEDWEALWNEAETETRA